MFFVVYVSSAVRLLDDRELLSILEVSRRNNAQADITGLLLYKEGNFMQCLEGPRESVRRTLEKIKADPRHRGMIVLMQDEHREREFSEWSMGFKKMSGEPLPEAPGYNSFLELPLTSEEFLLHPSRSLRLLLCFKNNIR